MSDHVWVEMSYVVIEPELQEDGSIDVHAREAALEAANQDAKQGCWICEVTLDSDTIHTECEGAPVDHPQSE